MIPADQPIGPLDSLFDREYIFLGPFARGMS